MTSLLPQEEEDDDDDDEDGDLSKYNLDDEVLIKERQDFKLLLSPLFNKETSYFSYSLFLSLCKIWLSLLES